MTGSPPRGRKPRCPVCRAHVRGDRLRSHISAVHPGQKNSSAVRAELKAIERRKEPASRRPRTPGLGWTRRRLLGVGAGIAVVALIAYAVLHAPATPVPQTGKPAPDFTIAALDGSSHDLSSYEGHPVVLWFVATFCSSCSQGTSIFAQQYYGQYHSAGVTLLEVESYNDLGQPGPDLSTFASQNGYSSQAGWVVGTSDAQGTHIYNPSSDLDVYYVVSSQGALLQGPTPSLPGNFGGALQAAQGQ